MRIFTTGVSNIAQSWISENGIILVGITVRLDQHEGMCLTMNNTPKHRILVVDDEPSVRESLVGFLNDAGYDVSTAEHGFDALLQLRSATPDVIISDLNMPQMSGFEFLSVVRRRFPEILVVAVSGAYESGDCVPGGVIADAFYAKV